MIHVVVLCVKKLKQEQPAGFVKHVCTQSCCPLKGRSVPTERDTPTLFIICCHLLFDTPQVRFADALGLDLTSVRTVFNFEAPPRIPPEATRDLELGDVTSQGWLHNIGKKVKHYNCDVATCCVNTLISNFI